jgi:hypothetical protein
LCCRTPDCQAACVSLAIASHPRRAYLARSVPLVAFLRLGEGRREKSCFAFRVDAYLLGA